ncbi:MAG: hypothetical protein M1825_006362 [Sarcosagium campestre]|nr:MAG: hypothetical protein M1825_006362 [Sarcosagium campestre]
MFPLHYGCLLVGFAGQFAAAGSPLHLRDEDDGQKSSYQGKKGSGQRHGGQQGPSTMDMEKLQLQHYLYFILAAIVALMFVYRITLLAVRYIRTITCMNNEKQAYFAIPSDTWQFLRRHLLYAPLGRTRHSREFQVSSAVNVGTMPTRFQTLFLACYIGLNAAFCVVSIHWRSGSTVYLAELRNRTGVLAVVNMVPLFLLAARNNPLISWLNFDFDSFNLIHRWLGRIVVLESLVHTLAYMIAKGNRDGWSVAGRALVHGPFMIGGLIGTCAFVLLLLHSPSLIRHAFYETFLQLHIAFATASLVGLWLHLKDLPHFRYLTCVLIIWSLERFIRMARLVYRNLGRSSTEATVELLPGDAMRVKLSIARPWTSRPGQHLFVYMPSIQWWSLHPFSVAWSQQEDDLSAEKGLAMNRQDIMQMQKTTMSLVIRRRTGFTDKLFQKVQSSPTGVISLRACVEGPYGELRASYFRDAETSVLIRWLLGGVNSFHSYGTVLLFAGGIGITHQVPYVRDLVLGFANHTVAARKVVLVWVIQSPGEHHCPRLCDDVACLTECEEHLEWIRPYMTTILGLPRRREVLRILLFVTRPRSTAEIHSPSETVQMFPGRPNIETIVRQESENQVGAMGVSVCGTGSLSDDVRHAVRLRDDKSVEFVEHSFSW